MGEPKVKERNRYIDKQTDKRDVQIQRLLVYVNPLTVYIQRLDLDRDHSRYRLCKWTYNKTLVTHNGLTGTTRRS